jgi:hypothetical protein
VISGDTGINERIHGPPRNTTSTTRSATIDTISAIPNDLNTTFSIKIVDTQILPSISGNELQSANSCAIATAQLAYEGNQQQFALTP